LYVARDNCRVFFSLLVVGVQFQTPGRVSADLKLVETFPPFLGQRRLRNRCLFSIPQRAYLSSWLQVLYCKWSRAHSPSNWHLRLSESPRSLPIKAPFCRYQPLPIVLQSISPGFIDTYRIGVRFISLLFISSFPFACTDSEFSVRFVSP